MFGKAAERSESSWCAGLEAGIAHVPAQAARLRAWFARWVEAGRILQRERARQMLEDPRVRAEIEAATARASRNQPESAESGRPSSFR